jgi:AraC-like DNA-binding protein
MTLLIDTSSVSANDRAEYWAEAAAASLHPLRIRTGEDYLFSARMWGERLASTHFYRVAAAPNTMTRTPSDVAAGDPDSLDVQLILRGRLRAAQRHRTVALGPGDMTIYDTSSSTIVRADEAFETLVLRIPKETLGKQAANIARLSSVRIPCNRGLPRLAARFFLEAATGLADKSIANDDSGLEGHIVDLVRRLYVDIGSLPNPERSRSMAELLLRAQAEIEIRLGDPGLNPEQLANACFISTRYLHRVFESEGFSVCEFIRSARLERCRRDLLDPALADQPIQAIASRWGLRSAPHFSRLFREAYGCSPREFRRTASRPSAPPESEHGGPWRSKPRAQEHADAWARAGWK